MLVLWGGCAPCLEVASVGAVWELGVSTALTCLTFMLSFQDDLEIVLNPKVV